MKKSIVYSILGLLAIVAGMSSCKKVEVVADPEPVVYSGDIETSATVDLGLSVDWAGMNLGAQKPQDCGNYYTWADVNPVSKACTIMNFWMYSAEAKDYSPALCGYDEALIAANCVYDKAECDPAYAALGANYRVPTPAEVKELETKCTWLYAKYDGVVGYVVTSNTNNKSIFIPCAGYYADEGLTLAGKKGLYWTNTGSSGQQASYNDVAAFATAMTFSPTIIDCYDAHRYLGASIRPVADIVAP